jgi:hypothetical protein
MGKAAASRTKKIPAIDAVHLGESLREALFRHFSEKFFRDFLEYYDDIRRNSGKYHMSGIGMSIRNAMRSNVEYADAEMVKNTGNPIWLDNNWLGIVVGLHPYVEERFGKHAVQ